MAEWAGLIKGAMSKRTIVIGLVICLVLGGAAAGYLGYRLYMKNHPAVGMYTMEFPAGTRFKDGIKEIEKVMESDLAMERVVADLDLMNRFKVASDDEAKALVRERLLLQQGKGPGQVHVIYLDRKNEVAMEILQAIHEQFVRTREARAVLRPNVVGP